MMNYIYYIVFFALYNLCGGRNGLSNRMAHISNNTKLLMFYLFIPMQLTPGDLEWLLKYKSINFFLQFIL